MDTTIFRGCSPALMTPCRADRTPDTDALVRTAKDLMSAGMSSVVYCGSMGDWPLLTDEQRQQGVQALVDAEVPVVVGTGAVNTQTAVDHARHAARVKASGLMVIPRVLSRGTSVAAQRAHFVEVLSAAPELPAVIYNSPYYGYETKADLFFTLRAEHSNLIGFKEFGGSAALSYAAEHITSGDDELMLLVGVDTQVFHGYVHCGAKGAITGLGNALPQQVLRLIELCNQAADGDAQARRLALELDQALHVLATFDEGPDLVLFYKHLMTLVGHEEYRQQLNPTDRLSESQRAHIESQLTLFQSWWQSWPGRNP